MRFERSSHLQRELRYEFRLGLTMTSPLVVPRQVAEPINYFLGVLDEANALVEEGRSQEAESCFDHAQHLAGADQENQLLVDLGRMCLWIEQQRHAEALACANHCLKKYDDFLSASENGCLKQDLLVQRALSLMGLNRRRPALDVMRFPDTPKATSDQVRPGTGLPGNICVPT